MGYVRVSLLVCCLVSLAASASPEQQARRWLAQSDGLVASLSASGVRGQYQAVQLKLLRSLGYAAIGDVEQTLANMPFTSDEDDWLSGGDGMVRQLLIGDALRSVHDTLFRLLLANGNISAVHGYLVRLNQQQKTPDLYVQMGRIVGTAGSSAAFGESERAQFQLGNILKALDESRETDAVGMMKKMDAALRASSVDQLGQLLLLEGDWQSASQLYAIDAKVGPVDPRRLTNAAMLSVRSGSSQMLEELVALLGDRGDEAARAQLALSVLQTDPDFARRLFEQTEGKQNRTWETVALQLKADAWLAQYYAGLKDPWRRAERFYQLALRQFRDGDVVPSGANVRRAADAAALIQSASTQALAYQLLAQYFAATGNPARVREMIDRIGGEVSLARYRGIAMSQLVIAWSHAGNPVEAMAAADAVADVSQRIDALVTSAVVFHPGDPADYQKFVGATRRAIGELLELHARSEAWRKLVEMQLAASDFAGATGTANLAPTLEAKPAINALVTHHLSLGNFKTAIETAKLLPDDSQWSRQKAFSDIVKAASAAGEIEVARASQEAITQIHIRDISLPPLVRALIMAGQFEAAEAILAGVSREDTRAELFALITYEYARQQRLPSTELMNHAPNRSDASLCWAVAAAVPIDVQAIAAWLDQLTQPGCKAFARVGAAYASIRPGEADFLFSLIDPTRTGERMSKAMQRQAVMNSRR